MEYFIKNIIVPSYIVIDLLIGIQRLKSIGYVINF